MAPNHIAGDIYCRTVRDANPPALGANRASAFQNNTDEPKNAVISEREIDQRQLSLCSGTLLS